MRHAEERATLEAFGSTALVAVTDAAGLATARALVERIVAEFDLACSRFRQDSELSAVNAAAGAAVHVGPVLLGAGPGGRPLASVPGWRTVSLDPERSTIRVAGGVSLDLGATAKALAADRAAA